jgi:uncharacterized membrane protein YedE/YeeE
VKQLIAAFASGLVFAIGLGVSGMTLPTKVQGFLDIFGDWDPSLAFVMGGAVIVYTIGFKLVTKRQKPLFAGGFSLPTRNDLTPRLTIGSAMFGVGWGLAGLCPGPAMVATSTLSLEIALFVAAMFAGFGLHNVLERQSSSSDEPSSTTLPDRAPCLSTVRFSSR